MAYEPTVWNEGDLITSTKLNKLEQGVADNTGKDGISPTITIGEVTEGDAPSVTNSGTESALVLDFVLPKGEDGTNGADGAAATITVGEVTTGEAGTQAQVTNEGTSSAAILNFVIPKGETGAAGIDGKSIQSIELVKDGTGAIVSGTVKFTDESTAPITITTQES